MGLLIFCLYFYEMVRSLRFRCILICRYLSMLISIMISISILICSEIKNGNVLVQSLSKLPFATIYKRLYANQIDFFFKNIPPHPLTIITHTKDDLKVHKSDVYLFPCFRGEKLYLGISYQGSNLRPSPHTMFA